MLPLAPWLLLSLSLLLVSCADQAEKPSLIVLGIDGATWDALRPMMAAGELPNFQRITGTGASGKLMTLGPAVSPVIWTTFVTGHFGRQHGILDFTYPYTPGPKVPVESLQRLEPAIWNLASDAGQRVAVVGYFASHPADPVNGVMVTDRAIQKLDNSIYPADYFGDALATFSQVQSAELRKALFHRFFSWPHEFHANAEQRAESLDPDQAFASSMVTGRVDADLIHSEYLRRVTRHLLENDRFDLLISYFRIVDYASHSLWIYHDDSDYPDKPDPAIKALLGPVVAESYRYMDDVLGEILDRMQPQDNLLIISDHGFGSATGPYAIHGPNPYKLNGNHRPDGIFLGYGPAFANKGDLQNLTIVDVMPLLTHLLGLPLADDLPGSIPFQVLADEAAQRRPAYVADYPRTITGQLTTANVDEQAQAEAVKQLRGLGYINEDFESGRRDEDYEFWNISPNMLLEHVVGEAIFYILRDEPQVALDLINRAAAERPEMGRVFLAYVSRIWTLLAERFPSQVMDADKFHAFEELSEP